MNASPILQRRQLFKTAALAVPAAGAALLSEKARACKVFIDPPAAAMTPGVPTALAILGATPAQIHARYTTHIEQNVLTNSAAMMASWTDAELTDLATIYGHVTGGDTRALLQLFARKLTLPNHLHRVAAAFGHDATSQALVRFAHPSVALAFESSPRLAQADPSPWLAKMLPLAPIAPGTLPQGPNFFMTFPELWTVFRSSGWGAESLFVAASEMSLYCVMQVSGAYAAGYLAGSFINSLIDGTPAGNAVGSFVWHTLESLPQNGDSTYYGEFLGSTQYDINYADGFHEFGLGYLPLTTAGDYACGAFEFDFLEGCF